MGAETTMHPIIAEHLPQLEELCRRYNVERLEVFGSVANGTFDPERSDVDLLVRFGPCGEMGEFYQFIDFLLGCEDVFGRRVDLVEDGVVSNPYLRRAIDRAKSTVYAG